MNKKFTSGDIEIEVRYGGITITNWATPSHTDIPEEKFSDLRLAFAEWCLSTLEPEPLMAPLCQEARDKMGVPTCFNRNCPRCYNGRLPLDQHVLAVKAAEWRAKTPKYECRGGAFHGPHPHDGEFCVDCPVCKAVLHHSPASGVPPLSAECGSTILHDAHPWHVSGMGECSGIPHDGEHHSASPGVFCAYCDWKGATVTDLGKHSLDHPEHWPTPSEDEAWDRRLDEGDGR